MSTKSIILFALDILIFVGLLKLGFKTFKEVKRCFLFLIKPDLLSIFDKTYEKDFNYTYKFILVVIIPMSIIVFIEMYLFYS